MSTYVLSDIHGQYFAYKKMLEKIKFKEDDFLYVLGDCIDRGPDGIRILQDVKKRKNAELIIGNHELMLLNALQYFKERESSHLGMTASEESLNAFELWTHPCNGGEGTCLEFLSMSKTEQDEMEEYLRSLRLIKRIKIGMKTFHLSHSFSIPKQFGKEVWFSKVSKNVAESIVWESLFDKKRIVAPGDKIFGYQRDTYIVGHIFTQRLENIDAEGKGQIFKSDNYKGYKIVDIDCGMALNSKSSQLGCMCLETGEEFYVSLLED